MDATQAPATPASTPAPAPAPSAGPIIQTRAQLREAAIAAMKAAPSAPPAEAPASAAEPSAEPPKDAAPPAEPEKKPEPVSPKLAELAKRDRELREREAAIKEKAAAFEAYEAAKKKAALDPLAGLEALGLTLESVIDFAANGKKPTADVQEKSALDSVRAEVEAMKKAREEEQAKQKAAVEEHARQQWKAAATEAAKKSEKLEYVATVGDDAVMLAMQRVEAHFSETGEAMPMEQALSEVESELEALVERLLTSNKTKGKLGNTQPAVSAASESGQRNSPRTLTNAAAAMAPPPSGRPLTREERKAAAAAAIRSGRIGG